ncbi:hemerythrin domain-containing protein [Tissierella creatinophila]|nr:hemerythrin domain-containing protein [Tissierella creatinophila]
MDVLKEIKKEHDEFRKLIKNIENSKGDKKQKLFIELYTKIKGHHEAEERVVFPDVKERADEDGKDTVMEMIEEHSLGAYQFSVIQRTGIDNETWDAKFSVLKEVLTHHMDEEENEFFKTAREVLKKEELEAKYDPFENTMDEYKKKQEEKLKQ